MEFAGLRAMALVHEDEDFAFGVETLGQGALNVLEEGINVALIGRPELVNQ